MRAAIEARRARFDAAEQLARDGQAADVTREALALYEEKGNVLQAGQARERLDRLTA